MKRSICIVTSLIIILSLMAGCTQKEDVQLGSLNAPKQILEELIVGDIEGSLGPFRGDLWTDELREKMAGYVELLDGREYLRCECVNYGVVGTRKEGIYEETTYHKIRPLREFCVSDFRQNQEYHVFNVQDEGLFPLSKVLPVGWDGMRAVCGVNAGAAFRESCFKGISLPCGRRT